MVEQYLLIIIFLISIRYITQVSGKISDLAVSYWKERIDFKRALLYGSVVWACSSIVQVLTLVVTFYYFGLM